MLHKLAMLQHVVISQAIVLLKNIDFTDFADVLERVSKESGERRDVSFD